MKKLNLAVATAYPVPTEFFLIWIKYYREKRNNKILRFEPFEKKREFESQLLRSVCILPISKGGRAWKISEWKRGQND